MVMTKTPELINLADLAVESVKRTEQDSTLVLTALDSLYLVPLFMIDTVDQPRNFEEEMDEEDLKLADQIAHERTLKGGIAGTGILQAILLRPNGDASRFKIVAGERRFRASSHLGLPNIPAFIREMSAAAAWRSAIVENIQRKDLKPIEEAQAFLRWMQDEGISQEEIAAQIGRSLSFVTARIDMLRQPSDLREMISVNPKTTRAVRELSGLPEQVRRPLVEQLKSGVSYTKVAPEIRVAKDLHVAHQRRLKLEKEGSDPNEKKVVVSRLPRVAFAELEARMAQAIEETIDVCRDVPPTGEKKREMLATLERLRERLLHLEEII